MLKKYKFRSPLSVQFELTDSCNNNCIFCYNDTSEGRNKKISLLNAKKIIDNLALNKVFTLVFTGGEPLLYEDLPELIMYAKSLNIETGIITNGILLKEQIDDLIKVGIDTIQVSILGYDSDTHDNLTRNKGSFNKAVDGLIAANERNIITTVNTTLIRNNYDYIENIYELVKKMGAKRFSVTRYIINDSIDLNLSPTIEQTNQMLEKFIIWNKEFPVKYINALPLCSINRSINIKDLEKIRWYILVCYKCRWRLDRMSKPKTQMWFFAKR